MHTKVEISVSRIGQARLGWIPAPPFSNPVTLGKTSLLRLGLLICKMGSFMPCETIMGNLAKSRCEAFRVSLSTGQHRSVLRLFSRERLFLIKGHSILQSLSCGTSGKELSCQCRRCKRLGFNTWIRKITRRRKQPPTPVFLPGKFHKQRSLVSYSPFGFVH